MLRAERISETIIKKFTEVGLIRAFVGMELATKEEGKLFGRKIDPDYNLQMLEAFHRNGVETVSNLMLVHPYSTVETITGGLEYLKRVRTGLFETTRMMPYHGTRLMDRLQREGRLDGNPLRYGYGFDDSRITRFTQLYAKLRTHSFRDYSLAYYAHDVFVSMSLVQHLYPERKHATLSNKVELMRQQINHSYLKAYNSAIKISAENGDPALDEQLVAFTTNRVQQLQTQLAVIDKELNEILAKEIKRYSPLAGAAAAIFAFSMTGASLGGCYQTGTQPKQGSGTDDTETNTETNADAGNECSQAQEKTQIEDVRGVLEKNVPCFAGHLKFDDNGVLTNVQQSSGSISLCNEDDYESLKQEAAAAVSTTEHECISGFIDIDGDINDDFDLMDNTSQEACEYWRYMGRDFVIELDEQGFVINVFSPQSTPETDETAACVLEALKGLQFPCLANFDVCPEYLIAE